MMQSEERGVAYRFWVRINQEMARQRMDQLTLIKKSGISATTINNLKRSTRPPLPRIVDALSSALGIDYNEGLWLAGHPGAVPPPTVAQVDVREAIRTSDAFSEAQKATLLEMTEVFERANRQRLAGDTPASESQAP